jgi:hypothetical protein
LRDEQEKKIDTQNKEKITTSNIVSNLDIEDLLENELFEKLNKEESIIIDKANNDYKKNIDENIELIKQYYDYLNYNDYKSAYDLKITNTSLENFITSYDF